MYTADQWYTSGTFYAAASLIAIVVVGAVTIWVTYVVGATKRQFTYCLLQNIPLASTASAIPKEDLQVVYRGASLAEPRVLALRLSSRGHRDIRSDDFDQGKPLEIEIGAHIIAQLSVRNDMPGLHISGLRLDKTRVVIEPSLIRKRQSVILELLVDGYPSKMSYTSPLVDVEVREQSDDEAKFFASSTWLWIAIAIALVSNVAYWSNSTRAPEWWSGVAGLSVGILLMTLYEYFQARFRKRDRHP